MPDPSNRIAKADIEKVLERLAVDSSLLVYANFNILVSCPADKVTPVTSYLETKLYGCGIMPSRTAYNQLSCSPTASPATPTLSIRLRPVSHPVGRRPVLLLQGAPEGIGGHAPDHILQPTGRDYPSASTSPAREGKVKMTDNANFFCIGPSGSGKSFHMYSTWRKTGQNDGKRLQNLLL